MLFILALAVGGVLRATLGKVPGSLVTGGVVAVIAWFVVGAISMALVAGVVALLVTLLGGGMLGRGMGGYYGGGGRGGGMAEVAAAASAAAVVASVAAVRREGGSHGHQTHRAPLAGD